MNKRQPIKNITPLIYDVTANDSHLFSAVDRMRARAGIMRDITLE